MKASLSAAMICGTMFSLPALAMVEPIPDSPAEPRMRHVEYTPDDVVKIVVPQNGETQIIISPDEEKVQFSVSQQAWRHARAGNSLVIAANPGATTTFAHAVSILPDGKTRTYTFELIPAGIPPQSQVASADTSTLPQGELGYASVRFTYTAYDKEKQVQEAAAKKKAAIEAWRSRQALLAANGPPVVHASAPVQPRRRCDFMWRGWSQILPTAVCDRGATTEFVWPGQFPVPAIFTVTQDGREQSVTQAPDPMRPGVIVVPNTALRWVLRSGPKMVAELYNAAYDPLWSESTPVAEAQPANQQSAAGR